MLNLLDATCDEIHNEYSEVLDEYNDLKFTIDHYKKCKKCKEFRSIQKDLHRLKIYLDRLDKLRDDIPF